MFFHTDKTGLGQVVQNIGIRLVIFMDVHSEIRDKCLTFHALNLMDDVPAVGISLETVNPSASVVRMSRSASRALSKLPALAR